MKKANLPATERVYFNPGNFIIPSERGDWDLLHDLLPKMTQEQALKHTFPKGYHPISTLEHFELFTALYNLKNSPEAQKAREFLEQSLEKSLLTLTKVRYRHIRRDIVTHYNRTKRERKILTNVGADYFDQYKLLSETDSQEDKPDGDSIDICKAFTGKKLEKLREVVTYLLGPSFVHKTYLSRWGKPKKTIEFMSTLSTSGENVYINARSDIHSPLESLGVKFNPH